MAAFKTLLSFATAIGVANALVMTQKRADGGYIQDSTGKASFTHYSGCNMPACGIAGSGYTAAINQLAFGSIPGLGPGDACGRCFALTAEADPYSPSFTGPFGTSIVVKVTDMCPVVGNEVWCGQTATDDTNQYGQPFHFDICEDSGGAGVFFPSGHGALTGSFVEVPCSQWSGSDGSSLWPGSCIAGESAGLWPSVGCGNQGTAPGSNASPATTGAQQATTVTPVAVATSTVKPTTVTSTTVSPTTVATPTTVANPTTVADTTTVVTPTTVANPTTVQTTTAAAATTNDSNVCNPSSSTSASGPTATHWGQCGGTGYTGPTNCESPYTCQGVSPPWYYQCL